jgi:hypothetical protein
LVTNLDQFRMISDDLRRLASHYRALASECREAVARLLLDQCARSYEAEASRYARNEPRRPRAH